MLKFRPHHFMCTLGFEGKGYSLGFIQNYQTISEQLKKAPDTPIHVSSALDSICKACPQQINKKLCKSQMFIEKLDEAHKNVLSLQEGQIITWRNAKALIRKRMSLKNFHAACEGCDWKNYGVCERALRNLRKTSSQ